MRSITVLYDEHCPLCVRCADWMWTQTKEVPMVLMGAHSKEAAERFSGLPWLGYELCVLSDEGDAWVGPGAFIMCLWALRDYRDWSYRLSADAFAPLAERFFRMLSNRRGGLAKWVQTEQACEGDRCRTCAPRPQSRA